MKTTIYMNHKKISKKKAQELIGKERLQNRIEEAHESFIEDPLTLISWMDGMTIRVGC